MSRPIKIIVVVCQFLNKTLGKNLSFVILILFTFRHERFINNLVFIFSNYFNSIFCILKQNHWIKSKLHNNEVDQVGFIKKISFESYLFFRKAVVLDHSKSPCEENFIPDTKVSV